MRRNAVDMKTARTWGPEGEEAFEMETAVRETMVEVAREIADDSMDTRLIRAAASIATLPDTIRSSYSPVGQRMYADLPDSKTKWPLEPSWNSVFVAPVKWDMNPPDYDILFALTTKRLNETWARPGSEWFWDTVDVMAFPPLFEFSLGPKPWMWEQRYGSPANASINRRGEHFDIGDLGLGASSPELAVVEESIATRRNLLLLTPYGSGDAMTTALGRRIVTLLPTYSRAVLPFRAPPHTINERTTSSEVYLARYGVLYLEEIADFSKQTLRAMAATIEAIDRKKRPLVVASTATNVTSAGNKARIDIIGFPLVVDLTPWVSTWATGRGPVLRRGGQKSDEIRKRIMSRERENPPALDWWRGDHEWTAGARAGAEEAGRDLAHRFGAKPSMGSWSANELTATERQDLSVAADAIEERRDDEAKAMLKMVDIDPDLAFSRWDMNRYSTRKAPPVSMGFRDDFQDSYLATVWTFIEEVMPTRNPAKKGAKPRRVVAKLARDLTPFEGAFSVTSPGQLAAEIGTYMDLANEVFLVLFVNVANKVVGYTEFTSGAIASVEVHPGGIFQAALLAGAAAFITIHNHPSGDPKPSSADYALWSRLRLAGETMGIPLIDNLVIGARGKFFSQSEDER